MSKIFYEEFLALHDAGVKIFDNFIEVSGIKKLCVKILDWIVIRVKE